MWNHTIFYKSCNISGACAASAFMAKKIDQVGKKGVWHKKGRTENGAMNEQMATSGAGKDCSVKI